MPIHNILYMAQIALFFTDRLSKEQQQFTIMFMVSSLSSWLRPDFM